MASSADVLKGTDGQDDMAQVNDKAPLKRSADSMASSSPPQDAELARLERVYEAAQSERRTLLRQLKEMLDQESSSPSFTTSNTNNAPTSSNGPERQIQASMDGNFGPMQPMTPSQEAETTVAAQGVIKEHIRLLSKYNEIRDIGQGLIGLVAEERKVRIRDCQEEFGVGEGD